MLTIRRLARMRKLIHTEAAHRYTSVVDNEINAVGMLLLQKVPEILYAFRCGNIKLMKFYV